VAFILKLSSRVYGAIIARSSLQDGDDFLIIFYIIIMLSYCNRLTIEVEVQIFSSVFLLATCGTSLEISGMFMT